MKRPLVIGLILGALAFVILVVVGAVAVVNALDRQNAVAEHETASAELADVVDDVSAAVGEADQVISLAVDPLLPAESIAALTAERDAVAAELDAADTLGVEPEALSTDELRDLTDDIQAATAGLSDDDDRVLDALGDVVLATQAAAVDVEATNFEAENQPHIAFRHTVVDLDSAAPDTTADILASYLDAAHTLEASHAKEIAERAGPLFDRRIAVEQFARSIAGGVLLDFDWAVTVNGYGTGGSYGGTSYWYAEDGGYATITLSDSVATMWPGAGVQSLVAHEVGHAILSKCTDLLLPVGVLRERGGVVGDGLGDRHGLHGRRKRRVDLRPPTGWADPALDAVPVARPG